LVFAGSFFGQQFQGNLTWIQASSLK
jgi:hypothetical protein